MINFPSSPSVNDQYEFQGKVWRWTGAVWSIVNAGDDGTSYELVNGGSQFVLNANGSVTFNDGTIQSTAYTGNANGEYSLPTATTSTLGGVKIDGTSITIANGVISAGASDLSGYQTTAGLSANVAKLTSNNTSYLGGVAANQYAYANQISGAYTLPTANATTLGGVKIDGSTITIANGVISSPNQDLSGYQTTAGLSANVATLTSNNSLYLGGIAANQYAYTNATYTQILWINPSPSPATTFRTNIEATDHGAQIDITTGIPGFGSTYTWVLDEVGLSFPNGAGIQTVPFVGDADLLGGIAADQYAYANAIPSLTGYQTTAGLSANVAKLSANNTLYLGGIAANQYAYANQITTYTLPTANTTTLGGVKVDGSTITIANGVISSPNQDLSGYQTTAGLSANVAMLTSNNSLYLGGVAANQYAYANSLSSYQTTAGLSANVATLTSNNASFLGTRAANQYAYANGSNFSINNPITITYAGATPTGYALTLASANTQGGTGYADFLKVTNNSAGATAIHKSFRLTSGGGIEIVNSGYTATIFGLSDTGNLSVSGDIQVNGKKAVNGPAFSAYAAAILQTIPTDAQTKVLFQTEEFDTASCYTNSRFTPNVEGYYQLNAEVRIDGTSGTGEMMIILYKNGSEYKRGTNQSGTQIAANFWAMQVSSVVYANGSTDYFEIYVQQGSGGSRTVTAVNNPAITWFNGCMLRGA